jgi:hypothetical protein
MNRDAIARVLGNAMVDSHFSDQLKADPAAAANSIGVHLSVDQVTALKKIDMVQLQHVGGLIRGKLGQHAIFDQQQQQARMD